MNPKKYRQLSCDLLISHVECIYFPLGSEPASTWWERHFPVGIFYTQKIINEELDER